MVNAKQLLKSFSYEDVRNNAGYLGQVVQCCEESQFGWAMSLSITIDLEEQRYIATHLYSFRYHLHSFPIHIMLGFRLVNSVSKLI